MVSNISIFVMYTMYFLAALFGYLTFKGESSSPRNSFWNFVFAVPVEMCKCLYKNQIAGAFTGIKLE